MRIGSWIKAEIRNWLGVEPECLGLDENGVLTMHPPHPDKVAGRAALKAVVKRLADSKWAVGIGCTLLGVILGKLL